MPTIKLQLDHKPSFEFDVDEGELEKKSEQELLQELSVDASIELGVAAPEYEWKDWELSVQGKDRESTE